MAKILWVAPWSLHDTSSGAAIQVRTMLEKLVERGIEVMCLNSVICDGQASYDLLMLRTGLTEKLQGPERVFRLEDRGVQYVYTRSASWNAMAQTRAEQTDFFSVYHSLLDSFRPDMVMSYGGDCLDMAVKAEAKLRGLAVVSGVYNGNYTNCRFGYTDMVITDSHSVSAMYAQYRTNILPLGPFIRTEDILASHHERTYITFINPIPSKGVALFARLALMAEKERPDLRFLLVQGRGDPSNDFAMLHDPDQPDSHPLLGRSFTNTTYASHTADMRPVYGASAVLMAPSLWYEGFGRVATEALINGIPVLASTSGGLPDNVGQGGICLPPPAATREDTLRIPTEDEMRPWFKALINLYDNRDVWTSKALIAAQQHNIEHSTDRVMAALQPLLARNAGSMARALDGSGFA